MAIKAAMGEETVMNMTPMIDIVFNLVIFFMLTLDLSTKEYEALTLPFAHKGVEDKDDPNSPTDSRKLIVNVLPDGKMIIKGQPYDLDPKDPSLTPLERGKLIFGALRALRTELGLLTADDATLGQKLHEPDGHSMVPIQVHADRAAAWRYVQWVIATASSRGVMMYKIHFSVKNPAVEDVGTGGP